MYLYYKILLRVLCQNGRKFCFVRRDIEGFLIGEDDEAGLAAGGLFDVADFGVIHRHLGRTLCLAEVGGQLGAE